MLAPSGPPCIDTHNDSIVFHIRSGNRRLTAEGQSLPGRDGLVSYLRGPLPGGATPPQLDLARMKQGAIDAAFFAVDVTRAWNNHLAYLLDAIGFFLEDLAEQDELVVVRTASEIQAAKYQGRRGALLVLENSDAVQGSLNILHALHEIGIRSITLTHNPSSLAAAGNGESASGGGLTQFGRSLVTEMNRLGMLIDVSHIAERGFWDVLSVADQPVIASHSCCSALCAHPRNLTDSQLRALGCAGGVACITFVPSFLWEDGGEGRGALESVERILDHVDHAVNLIGAESIGIGSDFDGGGTALPSATDFPLLAVGLSARGYGDEAINGIMGGNVMRLLQATLGS